MVLLIGSNIQKDQPILAHRIRKASLNGARIMDINPLAYHFNFRLRERETGTPAAMVQSLAAVARAVCDKTGTSAPSGLDLLLEGTEVSHSHLMMAERLCGEGRRSLLLGNQASMHPDSATLRMLAGAIAAATGATLGILSDGANSAGGWLAGAVPHRNAGGESASTRGLDASAMCSEPRKAYLNIGVEPELDCASPAQALKAQREAAFVVMLTPFVSDTMREYADVLLPTTPATETSGTFVNVSGQWQSFSGVVKAAGEARPAWKVLRVLGNFLNLDGFDYMSSEEVRDEVAQCCADKTCTNEFSGTLTAGNAVRQEGMVRISDVGLYAVDGMVRRAQSLQQTPDALTDEFARINAAEAARQGLGDELLITVNDGDFSVHMKLAIDERVPDGALYIPLGTEIATGLGAFGSQLRVTVG